MIIHDGGRISLGGTPRYLTPFCPQSALPNAAVWDPLSAIPDFIFEMGQVYDLCAVTRENALFFLDYSLASSMETDEHLSLKEFQVSLRHFKSVEDAEHQRRFESPALIYYSGSGNCCSARFVEDVWVWISYKSGKLFLLSSDERCCNLSCSFNQPTTPSFP